MWPAGSISEARKRQAERTAPRRVRVAEPHVRVAARRRSPRRRDEVRREAHRAPPLGIEADPERDRLDRGALAMDRGAPLGGEAADAAAEGAQRMSLTEARERVDPDPGASHDPGPPPLEPGVDQVRVGDVLQPARHRVQPGAARGVGVRDARAHRLLEAKALAAVGTISGQLPCASTSSSSSESCSRSIMRPEVGHLVAVGDDPEVHVAAVAHHRDVQPHPVGDHRDRILGDQPAPAQ